MWRRAQNQKDTRISERSGYMLQRDDGNTLRQRVHSPKAPSRAAGWGADASLRAGFLARVIGPDAFPSWPPRPHWPVTRHLRGTRGICRPPRKDKAKIRDTKRLGRISVSCRVGPGGSKHCWPVPAQRSDAVERTVLLKRRGRGGRKVPQRRRAKVTPVSERRVAAHSPRSSAPSASSALRPGFSLQDSEMRPAARATAFRRCLFNPFVAECGPHELCRHRP